ncbi:MAG: peptidoglycan DD-metalloendopeptidase family protein [Rhizomicrobium sp.]|nr:peptidoglycan DD-metalloendopeptidase family protein [Rhizomicrobium sp.]
MSRAVPLRQLLQQPSTAEQFKALKGEIAKDKPALDSARTSSEALTRQTAELQQKLIDSAAKVEFLEREKLRIDAEVVRLAADYDRLSALFARDRVGVSRLLAVIERLQHDVPPAMAVRPDDALAAARGAMLIGASLPNVYQQAADLARRMHQLQQTRTNLIARRAEAVRNAAQLSGARVDLDRLLAVKRLEAGAAVTRYGVLKTKLDSIAAAAGNLQALLQKVAQLGAANGAQAVVTVAGVVNAAAGARRPQLIAPVVGLVRSGGVDGVGGTTAPGLTYATNPGSTVVAPTDGKILFAGSFAKVGHVLILEIAPGYHAVLAGLDRLDVRTGDDVLLGEPVGAMPKFDHESILYFELRQNGRGMNPAPFIGVVLRKVK